MLKPHRPHHYGDLVERWRTVAKAAGLRMRRCARAGTRPLYAVKSPALGATGGIYVSAGIHGDEPAATEALIAWAEKHASKLARWPLFLLPCLNPWGLQNNIRLDAEGVDLNRAFQRDDHPVIGAIKRLAAPHQFAVALMLHEDYDGEGFYLYEIQRETPYWGEDLVKIAARHVPPDRRRTIDGRKAPGTGLIRRKFDRVRFDRIGYPEAIWLHAEHAQRALTLETPSEFALERRVAAHVAVLEECVRRVTTSAGRAGA